MSLMHSSDTDIKMKINIEEFMKEFKKSVSPDHHAFSHSPLFSRVTSNTTETSTSLHSMYKHYPLPVEALIFDVVHSSVMDTFKS